jgi:hypothetical protein
LKFSSSTPLENNQTLDEYKACFKLPALLASASMSFGNVRAADNANNLHWYPPVVACRLQGGG